MLALRIITAICMLAMLLAAMFFSSETTWKIVCAAIAAIAGVEWARLAGVRSMGAQHAYAGLLVLLLFLIGHLGQTATICFFWLSAAIWATMVPWSLYRGQLPRARPGLIGAGVVMIVSAALALDHLRASSVNLLLLVLGIVWLSDTAAFFAGRAFGRTRLAPRISPGKTWEGVAAAMLAVATYACIVIWAFPGIVQPSWMPVPVVLPVLAFWLLLAGIGIAGDLFESMLKRNAGVKDSGTLLPGHGGMLDRIDAVMPVLPLAAIFYTG